MKRNLKRIAIGTTYLSFGLAVCILCACESYPLRKPSGGRPFEVLIVGDTDSIIRQVLEADAEGLPQSEPAFDVSTVEPTAFKHPLTMARNIVTLTIDPAAPDVRIRYEKNVYAEPQMIVRITAPTTAALRKYLSRGAEAVRQLLQRAEMNAQIDRLRRQRNVKAERMVNRMFGAEMMIPMDMTSSKRGRNFLWLSNNAARGMQNICIYTVRKGDIVALRDSVMRANIPGATDSMYMSTLRTSVRISRVTEKGQIGRQMTVARGLWEMKHDAMGGPFVLHGLDRPDGRIVVAEAFVYAPEMKKRNLMRLLEASLYTLNFKDNGR